MTEDKINDEELAKWGTLNVLGQPAEPICTTDVIAGFHSMVQDVAGVSIQCWDHEICYMWNEKNGELLLNRDA
jgi:hypothetical protein